tara:strand:+ start:1233 stop:2279 length:1047 start_codon:yes stop_codon:yes gene_type:complete
MGIGGVETGIRDISFFLKEKNIQNYILCEDDKKNFRDNNLNYIYLNGLKFKNIFDQIKIKKFITKLIEKKSINLVHISSRAPAFFLINFLKKKKVKIVTSIHNVYKPGFFFKNWYNSHLQKGDAIIFNSFFVNKTYKSLFQNQGKNYVIPRGVDIEYFKNSKKNKTNSFKKILLPSRISNWKGHDVILKFFYKFDQNYKDQFKLVFISDHASSYEKKIDQLITNLSLNNYVLFVKPTLNIKNLYDECYLSISVSTRPEGFGRTISESLSMSKPVLAPNYGGTKEQLNKFDKKILFNIKSYDSFFKSLNYVIKNYYSISKKSRKFIKKNYSSKIMCQKTLDIYNDLICK